MANWNEFRTAYHVAREGTVSAAAAALGVHHATVIRHVDALEDRLGTKLFQRHARGYTPTEAGQDLLVVAQTTDDQIAQLENRLKGRGATVGGDLVVTTLPGLSDLMVPVLTSFREAHPELVVRYLTSDRVFRLEYGEAHVAIRAGSAPQEPDNVVQKFITARIGLFAAKSYIDRKGLPNGEDDLAGHDFVAADTGKDHRQGPGRAPFRRWMSEKVAPSQIVFTATENEALGAAITAGAGIGFLPRWSAMARDDLVEIIPARDEWNAPFWLVTHMDLHRTAKVQAFLQHLKQEAGDWDI